MQIFKVGGAVRDALLGLPVSDQDYVVVGASPEIMMAQGFLPVGEDFPVFLHPKTHEEYALARTERKSGHGYAGFSFYAAEDVTLQEDLARRDLTINAMAQDENGQLFDPFDGQKDLTARVLRHVSAAFIEDPVRILRLARFYARFTDFSIAEETQALAQKMVAEGEVNHLVPERIWQELSRGLMEQQPARMIEALRACGALKVILPEVDALFGVPQRADFHPEVDTGAHILLALNFAAKQNYPLPVRFAVLMHDLGKALTPASILPRHIGHEERGLRLVIPLCERLRVPKECRDLAVLMTKHHGQIRKIDEMQKKTIVRLFKEMDAFRRPERFLSLLDACACDFHGRLGFEDKPLISAERWIEALDRVKTVDEGKIAQACTDKSRIPEAIQRARVQALS